MIDMVPSVLRRAARVSAVVVGVSAGSLAVPAFASAPTSWEEPASFSGLHLLTVLLFVPLAVIAVIALLTYLPSLVRGQSSERALVFTDRNEWFGGPRTGLDATAPAASSTGSSDSPTTGGAGAHW